MTEMGKAIQQAREERLGVKFMVGGAVVTDDYARQIGADVYARDAVAAAKAARELVVHKKDRLNAKGVSG